MHETLQKSAEYAKLTVQDGYLQCPRCRTKKMHRVRPDTHAENLPVFCRQCKLEMTVNIEKGQCFESRCQ